MALIYPEALALVESTQPELDEMPFLNFVSELLPRLVTALPDQGTPSWDIETLLSQPPVEIVTIEFAPGAVIPLHDHHDPRAHHDEQIQGISEAGEGHETVMRPAIAEDEEQEHVACGGGMLRAIQVFGSACARIREGKHGRETIGHGGGIKRYGGNQGHCRPAWVRILNNRSRSSPL